MFNPKIEKMLSDRAYRIVYNEGVGDLFLDVYLIGYTTDGESSLIVLRSTRPRARILYTAVIDSYKKSNVNLTADLLQKLEIKAPINLLCWTHPHNDHTLGIDDLLRKYCNNTTRIVMPNVMMIPDRLTKSCQRVLRLLNGELYRRPLRYRPDIVCSFQPGTVVQSVVVPNVTNTRKYNLTVTTLSPIDIVAYAQYDCTSLDPNKFSVALLFKLDLVPEMNLLFCGDIEDDTIECISRYIDKIPDSYNYIKLPHHSSDTSTLFMEKLNAQEPSEIACTTSFKTVLPKREVLHKYKSFVKNLYCTNASVIGEPITEEIIPEEISPEKLPIGPCGIVKVSFNIFDRVSKVKRIANSVKIKNEFII